MYLLVFYVPETHLEILKNELFKAGAGKYQNYDSCAWQTGGEGQFRPLDESKPFLGKKGQIEKVIEYKVEMVCQKKYIKSVLNKLIEIHPYEEPAYHVMKIKTVKDF